jgi:hypothetical protein
MVPNPAGQHLCLNCDSQERTWRPGPVKRAAQYRPQLSAVIGGKIG